MEGIFKELQKIMITASVDMELSKTKEGHIIFETVGEGSQAILPGTFFVNVQKACDRHDCKFEANPGPYGVLTLRIMKH